MYQITIATSGDIDLQLQNARLNRVLRQPDANLVDEGPQIGPHSLRMRVKDHNRPVQMVVELLPANGGDTAYLTVGCGSHAAMWWGRAIVTVYNGQTVIAKLQVDSGTNLGVGDVWGHKSTNIHLGASRMSAEPPRRGDEAQGIHPEEALPVQA